MQGRTPAPIGGKGARACVCVVCTRQGVRGGGRVRAVLLHGQLLGESRQWSSCPALVPADQLSTLIDTHTFWALRGGALCIELGSGGGDGEGLLTLSQKKRGWGGGGGFLHLLSLSRCVKRNARPPG